jgi:hypothetical protein
MNLWSTVVGVGLLLYVAFLIYRGEVDMTNKRRYKAPKMIYKRSEQPLIYWGLVALILIGAVMMLASPWW